jgi:hypothetical protein
MAQASTLVQFLYLQLFDLLTTIAFLAYGVKEANPVVAFVMGASPSPLCGLLVIKGAAVGLGVSCRMRGRERLLARINFFFAWIVVWNLVSLILKAVG